jgi:alkylation response protein AidB-like acyl-CoA dehydrogenase
VKVGTAIDAPITTLRGGEWILTSTDPEAVWTPERLTEEQRLVVRTTEAFVDNEVLPELDRMEQRDWTVARRLLTRCGELGLLSVDVPEMYGGLQLDKVTSMIVSERMARAASFASTFGAQANLTILPLCLFGTDGQKRTYLPKLITGAIVGAYCLSEAGSGSDALGAKATATRQADGSFVLNGEKMWITNGGFADIFIVFAKVDGEHFSAFIVERAFAGVTSGKEEHKMGLHGSSTTPILLQNVRVPAENLLGEIGKGHKVAFNVLNFGRFKLGAMCGGGARAALGEAARYAAERRQFGQPIAEFGAIRHKLGEMVAQTYAIESLLYRTAGMIDRRIAQAGAHGADSSAALTALEEYAIEASIAKVAGSEVLDRVLDENIQVHGGNGYVRDYPAERHYRDSRVNRIFEGTNEINRLLISGLLIRRAVKGELPLVPAAKALQDELMAPAGPVADGGSLLGEERRTVEALRKIALMILGLAMQTYGQKVSDEQEVLMLATDMLIDVYGADSAVLRAAAAETLGVSVAALQADAARVVVSEAAFRVESRARQALAAMTEGDSLRTALAALRRLTKFTPVNAVALRRRLADEAVRRGGYPLWVT